MLFALFVFAFARVIDDEIRAKFSQLRLAWTDEHIFYEMRLPRDFGYEANRFFALFARAAKCVLDKDFLAA